MPVSTSIDTKSWEADLAQFDARLPLHERVLQALKLRIANGSFSPTVPLPPESVIAQAYGVSLGTVRRVLGVLADDGVIERRQGDGTYLRRARMTMAMYKFFRHGRTTTGEIPNARILSRTVAPPPPFVAALFESSEDTVHIRRLRLWDSTPFLMEDIWLPLPRFAPFAELPEAELGPLLYPLYERLSGVVIASAREELTVVTAEPADAVALEIDPGSAVVSVDRTARSHLDEVVEVRRSRGPAADFHYEVEIR